ncbi:hypothetical protein [Actinomadura alba]|uniref:Uncharacterized protein n=1 Tax=Actinomadura alba TaxID=406431 RepID=A0ABR7LVJ5_9ACTN|nr:hypothetical protein [Actinomadura alba]MBC6468776.1 hypothetical protein [Actinomadura alba]
MRQEVKKGPGALRRSLGMPLPVIVALAALGVPRVVAHDLDLVGGGVNAVLVFGPVVIWIAVVLWRRLPNPFATLLAVGLVYGALLAVTHQILWNEAFGEDPPRLGGNLEGELSPAVESLVVRTFAFGSSVLTGVLVGVIAGAVGWLAARVLPGHGSR